MKLDGEEATLHITDQSVMFENAGRVSGFERSAIRMVKPDGEAMIIAYSVGNEVKSVRVEPLTAVASLVASGASPTPLEFLPQGWMKSLRSCIWTRGKSLRKGLLRCKQNQRTGVSG